MHRVAVRLLPVDAVFLELDHPVEAFQLVRSHLPELDARRLGRQMHRVDALASAVFISTASICSAAALPALGWAARRSSNGKIGGLSRRGRRGRRGRISSRRGFELPKSGKDVGLAQKVLEALLGLVIYLGGDGNG